MPEKDPDTLVILLTVRLLVVIVAPFIVYGVPLLVIPTLERLIGLMKFTEVLLVND